MVLVLVRVLLLLLSLPFVHWCCRAASDDDGYGHHDADGYDLRRQSIHIMIIVVMVASDTDDDDDDDDFKTIVVASSAILFRACCYVLSGAPCSKQCLQTLNC